ncbi:hypothetical protein C0993_000578 [Termitomyces sp. T159_Od127]|nr:hypothetical protein C0993_000578 [Termitomyces sp. T159_Od127]
MPSLPLPCPHLLRITLKPTTSPGLDPLWCYAALLILTPPTPLGCQRVKAYIQQHDKVFHSLHISLAEFAKRTCTLLIGLRHHDLSRTLEQWANRLLEFHKLYQCRAIPKSAQNTLQVDLNLWNKLHALVDKIHISPTLQHFENSIDPARSFYMQREEPIKSQDPVLALVLHQQEELNVASNILKAFNLTRGLFDQLAASPSALGDNPLTSTPALMLLSALHLPTTTMPPLTPFPTSMNQRPPAADWPLLVEPLLQSFNMITPPPTSTCIIPAVMHPLPTATLHSLANLQAPAHLNNSLKDHFNPPLLQDPLSAAPLMPTMDCHLLEDRHPSAGLRDCPWGTAVGHLL